MMVFRILIVDDDEDARILLQRALCKGGFHDVEIDTAADGREALERIAAAPPHVVITDVMMPRMNGFELCAALRGMSATAAIPVMIVTALEDESDRARGHAVGANDYLTKPILWSDFAARLLALLDTASGTSRDR